MDAIEAKKLEVGDRVYWGDDKSDNGIVNKKSAFAVFIIWINQSGWVHIEDFKNIRLLEKKVK